MVQRQVRTRRRTPSTIAGQKSALALKAEVVPYESALSADTRWALNEGSRHFEGKSAVFDALHKITQRLEELEIPHAVVGGMALFRHGFRRFTEVVDILISKDNLRKVHQHLKGRGYRPPFEHSKNLRDTENGVKIEFLLVGDYPGDGRVKPVSFPDPASVSSALDGIRYINLPTLIELKLASGMTEAGRLKDLSDVIELIQLLNLPADFSAQLNPYVQEKYRELWGQGRKRYIMRVALSTVANRLEEMKSDGVIVENDDGLREDSARLVTTDPQIAEKYGLVDESEFWGDSEDELAPDNNPELD